MASTPQRLRFKALLVDSKPPIRRTIDIDPQLTLDAVHDVLQIAFGWEDYHLHVFETARPYSRVRLGDPEPKRYGPPQDDDDGFAIEQLDEGSMQFGGLLSEQSSPVYYLYDYGDDWTLRLEFVELRPADAGEPTARVVKAKLRGPTEDSGGVPGWEEKRRIIEDPTDEDHDEIVAWLREMDPSRYPITDVVDLDELNEELADLLDDRSGSDR